MPIEIITDPVTKEKSLSISAMRRLIKRAMDTRRVAGPRSFDRISLVLWLCRLDDKIIRKPKSYTTELEYELSRIAKIKEPADRAIQVIRFLKRYADAKSIADAFHNLRTPREVERVEKVLDELIAKAGGGGEGSAAIIGDGIALDLLKQPDSQSVLGDGL